MSKRHQDPQIRTFCSAATCKCRQLSRSTKQIRSYTVTRPPAHTFCSAATCQCRQLSRSTNKLHSYTVTRPPADAGSYRVKCHRGTKIRKFERLGPAATCQCRQLSRSTKQIFPTPSRGHLRAQAAIALDVQEAPRSANSNILFRGHLPVQTAIALDQQASMLHRHTATCVRRQLSR